MTHAPESAPRPVVRLRPDPLVLVAVGGGVATGKSTVAARLAPLLDAVHEGSDEVHTELGVGRGLQGYTRQMEDEVYAELLRRAAAGLAAGRCVVIDGCFSLARERAWAKAVAFQYGAAFLFVECRAAPDVMKQRLAERDEAVGEPFWQAVADDLAVRSEPVAELPDDEYEVVDTGEPESQVLQEVAARVRSRREHLVTPSAVTFDCWSTLLYEGDWVLAHARRVERLREAAQEAGRPVSLEEATRAFDSAWSRHMQLWAEGEATGAREVARWGLEILGIDAADPAARELVAFYEEASHSSDVCALPAARETLDALGRAGIPCALVCDTGLTPGRVVRRHLDRLGLLDGLAAQIFSDEVGVPKPDPRIFREALGALGVGPERAIHVGDLRRTDVAGARSLGMRSVRIRARYDDTTELPEGDFVVDSHSALRDLLGV